MSTTYEDYKYYLQETSSFYVGSKYTLQEITENEEINFKFRKVIAESVIPKADPEDTLETLLYYLTPDSFVYQIMKQMKAGVRVSVLRKKKNLFGKETEVYESKYITIEELVSMSKEEKEAKGLFIQELKGSKLALLTI
ncbi:MAG: hypothetical protein IKS07_03615 [Lachnospiraceae bacterium]|nr:hypothetical protein [Lachnospiraceae bacterium]